MKLKNLRVQRNMLDLSSLETLHFTLLNNPVLPADTYLIKNKRIKSDKEHEEYISG